ncbi:MAG: cell division protein FtsA [Bacteroidaceae bacterium]|nr:cell division protein FtsA [Candidatus Colenecus caballi]MCQ2072986.1 cell division protein FtsA [Bacteroidaceae bacterium]
MENDKVIVAIELGSSKISGVAGQILSDGSLKVLAYASTPSSACIRHGAVYNLDRTANAIAEVIGRLENMLSAKIEKAYIGYNAMGLKSMPSRVERVFNADTVINHEIIDGMYAECERCEFEGYANLLQESQEYFVNEKRDPERDPMGVACRTIKGDYLNVLLKKQVTDYMLQCFSMAQVQILDGFVSPIAQADVALTEDDRKQGCALVDYGADITTVSVYKNGLLRYLRVIPLGGSLITRDLSKLLQIEPEMAEELKCACGLNSSDSETILLGGHKFNAKKVYDIIDARNEEIVTNVVLQIKASGYMGSLYAGVVLTGGGSQLAQVEQTFVKMMPDMRTPRIVTEPLKGVCWDEQSWRRGDGSQLALLSIMARGDENCCELPAMDAIDNLNAENQDKVVTLELFTPDGENAQDVRDRENEMKVQQQKAQQETEAQQAAEAPAPETGGVRKSNWFKKLLNGLMNESEKFFDEDSDNN